MAGPRRKCAELGEAAHLSQATAGTDVDPDTDVIIRRITMLRRMLAKHPEERATVEQIMQHYKQNQHPGTDTAPDTLAALQPAPPPASD